MKDYFTLKYKKNDIIATINIEAKYLIIRILQMNDYEILEIKDKYGEIYTLDYMIDIYKESIDIEYEDVKTFKETFELCYDYFKEAYKEKQIDENTYNRYINKLKEYKKTEKNLDKFIKKVETLYISRV